MVLIFIGIFIYAVSVNDFNLADLRLWPSANNWQWLIIPIGPVLFSLYGRMSIPIIAELNNYKNAPNLKKQVLLGTFIPVIIYLIFIFSIWHLSGSIISPDSVSGLIGRSPQLILWGLGLLGLLSLGTTYLLGGADVRKILSLDLKFPHWLSNSIVLFVPIFLWLSGWKNFITLVATAGGLFIPIEGLLILAMAVSLIRKNQNQSLLLGKRFFILLSFAAIILIIAIIQNISFLIGY